jgi:hypothetical protein
MAVPRGVDNPTNFNVLHSQTPLWAHLNPKGFFVDIQTDELENERSHHSTTIQGRYSNAQA